MSARPRLSWWWGLFALALSLPACLGALTGLRYAAGQWPFLPAKGLWAQGFSSFGMLALSGWATSRYLKARGMRLGDLGLAPAHARRGLLFGLAGGLVSLSAGLLYCAMSPEWLRFHFSSSSFARFGGLASDPACLKAVSVLLVAPWAAAEELLARGLLLDHARRRYGVWPALALSSLVFGAWHLLDGPPARAPITALLGLIFGWSYIRSGTLLAPITAHAVHNAALSLLQLSGCNGA